MILIKVLQKPVIDSIDGIWLTRFEVGHTYEVGNSVACLLLAEGWAEPVPFDDSTPDEPEGLRQVRETAPRRIPLGLAAELARRRLRKR